ncbi:hypothetical protein [Rhodococcus daqingensis]|uniref:Uncharacterized protein n=1 Tax=Rhodococcus daqingensis TaxID=2479363 RepID=A0ABW2S0Q5_9NOCA
MMLPMYEGRMGHQFNHRFASLGDPDRQTTVNELESADFVVQPQYWVSEEETLRRLERRTWGTESALLGHRRVARNNDERTCIAGLLPRGATSYGWIVSSGPSAMELCMLEAAFNSFAYDYLLRGSFSQPSIPQSTSEQVPVPTMQLIADSPIVDAMWIRDRVLELSYTSNDMCPLAQELGESGPAFVWNEERRSLIRAELDAAFLHLYGVTREDADHILDSFPLVRGKDEAQFDEFRTKRIVLDIFDAMQHAIHTGEPYRTILAPAPGHGPRHEMQEVAT